MTMRRFPYVDESKDETKKIFSFQNFKYSDYISSNRLTCSGYKIYNRGFENEFILVEAKLS